MNWVHCNSCFVQPGQDAPQFIITSCGHIFCVKCIEKASQDKCPACQCAFTTIELNAEMKPEVRDYFGDPIELAQKALTIARFQAGHTVRLTSRFRHYQAKYAALRSEAMKLSDDNIRLRKKLKSKEMVEGWYKSQLASMKRKLTEVHEAHKRVTSTRYDADFSPAPSIQMTPSSDYGSPHPTVTNANKYRSQPNLTPFITPVPSSDYCHGSSNYTRRSNISTGDLRYQNSDRGRAQRVQTPAEFSSPSVLRPLDFPSNRHTPLFRRNI